jgi:hypothetical protein
MRKIKIKKKQEDKVKRNVAIVFLVLLAFSTVGYSLVNSFNNNSDTVNNSQEGFTRQGNYWVLEVANQAYYFTNLPSEVENISISGNFSLGDYYNAPLYFNSETQGSLEILNNLGRYILRTQLACIDEGDCGEDLPIKNCSVDNIVIFVDGKDNVHKEDNCVYLSGNQEKAADKFLYELLKIN